jgi:hypothetical protein
MATIVAAWMVRMRGVLAGVAVLAFVASMLGLSGAAVAQGQGITNATVDIPPGTSVTLSINGVSQTFSAGDSIDLSQTISVPTTSNVGFSLPNGTSVTPDSGASFSVAASGNTVTVNLTTGTASAAAGTPGGNVAIANSSGITITGTDVSASFDPATQETTVEVNSGTAALSGSATNGTKTVTANETLNASDTTKKVFKVAFDDGTGNANTNSGFQVAAQTPAVQQQVPVQQLGFGGLGLAGILAGSTAGVTNALQVDSASP